MKQVAYLLLPMFVLTLQPVMPSTAQDSSDRLLVADLEKVPILLETDVGRQESQMRGQIVVHRFIKQRRVMLEIQAFNLLIGSVKSGRGRRGETGQISLGLARPVRVAADPGPGGDAFQLELPLTAHYALIDQEKGYQRADEKQQDDYPALTEEFVGTLKGQLVLPKGKGKQEEGSLTLQGDIFLGQRVVLASIRRIIVDIRIIVIDFIFRLCPNGSLTGTRTLCVRPVYVRSGPGDSTAVQQNFFNDEIANANDIWARCCIQFEVAPAIFVNRASLQQITTNDGLTSAEESDLLDEVSDDDCVEVFVIESFNPLSSHGGGATWGGGTADTKIISTANNPPINQLHLAHELGHAMGLCHPGTGCMPPRADGTPGSLMTPSGFFADNPNVLREDDSNNTSNPLLMSISTFCCTRPNG